MTEPDHEITITDARLQDMKAHGVTIFKLDDGTTIGVSETVGENDG